MKTRKKIIIFLFIIIVGLNAIFISLWLKGKEKEKMIIMVEGFEIEYNLTSREITMEDIDDIKLGDSMSEITDKLGEPDVWIGSGILRPVYFLKDNKVVVFHFKYPATYEDLRQIVLISENGESQIIKEKYQDFQELITYKFSSEEFSDIQENLKSGKDISLFELVDSEKLECIRNIDGIQYALLLSDKNEKLFIFFDDNHVVTDTVYIENDFLEQKDFTSVQEGVTLKSDIETLDGSPIYYAVSAKMVTGYIVKEGIIIIEYDRFLNGRVLDDPVVKSVNFYGNDEILSIMESDFFVSNTPYILPIDKQ